MAARDVVPVKSPMRELIVLAGSFAPNGSSALDLTQRKGLNFTVSRTSAGLFKITLSDKYADIVSAVASLQAPAAIDLVPQIGLIVASNSTTAASVEIRLLAAAVATDQAANANARVNFVLWVRNSAVKPTYGG